MIMNIMLKGSALIVCFTVLFAPCFVHGVSVSCMMAYEEGGARAVLDSPECPARIISAELSKNSTRNCNFATMQGRREYQEDRVVCNLDIKIQILGKEGPEEGTIGVAAIFDGHGGAEASELASRKLFDYFFLNVVFTAYKNGLAIIKESLDSHTTKSVHKAILVIDQDLLRPILEEALKKTIHDIDSEFTEVHASIFFSSTSIGNVEFVRCLFSPFVSCIHEALDKGYRSGSTATIIVLINGEYLIASVGDSKAIRCSQGTSSREVYAEELTSDHHPDREDERSRIEKSGGFVRLWGVYRVNGILAVSRAIGDIALKRYGVIAEPEVSPWRHFDPEKESLVVASDGIFEALTPQDVCKIVASSKSSPSADQIVRVAHKNGSMDNLSAIVISSGPKKAL